MQFFSCSATAHLGPRPPHCPVSRSQKITHQAGLLWMSDQLVAEAATTTTHNKQKRRASIPSARFNPAILEIKWPQT